MGEIFLAKSGQLTGFEKLCVIKKILPNLAEDRDFIRRFIDEAQVAIKLQHANVAQVFEVGMVEGEYFLALEYVEGRDLRRLGARALQSGKRMPADLALLVVREVAAGLAYAHRRTDDDGKPLNLVHCDISPPNVVVSYEGEVKVIDFGIAKSAIRLVQTNPSVGFGKVGYMAPEQLVKGGVVDKRTDVYAAGTLLFELAVGEKMFQFPQEADYREMARMVTQGKHARPSQRDPALADLDEILLRAVAPDQAKRFQSAEELRDAVQGALVRRNPTLTTDRLGDWIRELFADEIGEDRDNVKKASAVDLALYVDELTGAKTHTVSFAMAQAVSEENILDEQEDLERTPTAATELDPAPRPNRRLVLAAAFGLPLLALGATGAILLAKSSSAHPHGAPTVTVTSVATSASASPSQSAAQSAVPVQLPEIVVDNGPKLPTVGETAHPNPHSPQPPTPPHNPPTSRGASTASGGTSAKDEEAALQAKFQAVHHEYDEFTKAYGPRLESDWNDIMDVVAYKTGDDRRKKLDGLLDALRQKMAAQKK
jgi:serine/threonine-protein kinase